MKKKSTSHKLLLIVLLLLAGNSLKAQVSAIGDLNAVTKAVYCSTDQVKLTSASTGAVTYVWKRYPGIGTTGTATTLSTTTANLTDIPPATVAGYYTYVSTGLNADNCESTISDPITIYMLPGITASIVSSAPATTQYCSTVLPNLLTLTATGVSVPNVGAPNVSETFAYTYQWYKAGVSIANATASTYILNSTTDAVVGNNIGYTVKMTYVIKACTEATSNTINFNVIATPDKPVITIAS